MDIWDVLEIEPTEDLRAVKRAYAKKLKTIDLEKSPAEFQALRMAFEAAKEMIRDGDDWNGYRHRLEIEQFLESAGGQEQDKAPDDPQEPLALDLEAPTTVDAPGTFSDEAPIEQTYNSPSYAAAVTQFSEDLHQALSESGQEAANNVYNDFLLTELMMKIDSRELFYLDFLNRLAHWDKSAFPNGVARQFLETFQREEEDFFERALVEQVETRIKLEDEYQDFVDENKKDKAFEVLLEPLDEKKFKKLRRKGSFLYEVRNLLIEIEDENPELFQLNMDTPTIKWWLNEIKTTPITSRHFFSGFLGLVFIPSIVKVFFRVDLRELFGGNALGLLATCFFSGVALRLGFDWLKNYFRYQSVPFFNINFHEKLNQAHYKVGIFFLAAALSWSLQVIPTPYVYPMPLLILFLYWLSFGHIFYFAFLLLGGLVYWMNSKELAILFPRTEALFSHYLPGIAIGLIVSTVVFVFFYLILERLANALPNAIKGVLAITFGIMATYFFLGWLVS